MSPIFTFQRKFCSFDIKKFTLPIRKTLATHLGALIHWLEILALDIDILLLQLVFYSSKMAIKISQVKSIEFLIYYSFISILSYEWHS